MSAKDKVHLYSDAPNCNNFVPGLMCFTMDIVFNFVNNITNPAMLSPEYMLRS